MRKRPPVDSETADRILEQALSKPGVADAMRFWHLTRPVPGREFHNVDDADIAAID